MVWVQEWFTDRFRGHVMTEDQLAVAEQIIYADLKANKELQGRLGEQIASAFEARQLKGK